MALEFGPTREELQALAARRLREARALLAVGELDGAWYIGGYAIECALKAAIIREARFPPQNSNALYTHKLETLRDFAGLKAAIAQQPPEVQQNWMVVAPWSEQHRYDEAVRTQPETEQFLNAIDHPQHGVLQWIKQSW